MTKKQACDHVFRGLQIWHEGHQLEECVHCQWLRWHPEATRHLWRNMKFTTTGAEALSHEHTPPVEMEESR